MECATTASHFCKSIPLSLSSFTVLSTYTAMSKESFSSQASHRPTGVVWKELCILMVIKILELRVEIPTRATEMYAHKICIQPFENKVSDFLCLCATRLSNCLRFLRFKLCPLRLTCFKTLFGHDPNSQKYHAFS